jgi:hypothetical protein
MRTIYSVLALGALVSAGVLLSGSSSTSADHTGGPMQAISIDMNEGATPANTSSSLGTREACARINENDTLDADEDVIDGVLVDVTAEGIPPFHDSGTPGNPFDDTGGIDAFGFILNYSSASLTVDGEVNVNPAINILARNPGSTIINVNDTTPDDNADNEYNAGAIDSGSAPRESGSGVLTRLTLVSETGAGAATYPLTLPDSAHGDATGAAHTPITTNNASVAVGVACGDFDADGVPDAQDACPTFQGPPSNNGCPLPGPPAVGGTAGLIEQPLDSDDARISNVALIAGMAALGLLPGGLLVRQVVARRRAR